VLLVGDLEDADRAHEIKRWTRDVDIRPTLNRLERHGRFRDRCEGRRVTAQYDVEQPLCRLRLSPETRPHRTVPDLQGRLDRPGCDATDEDRTGMGAFGRGGKATREAEQDGAIDGIGRSRCDDGGRKPDTEEQGREVTFHGRSFLAGMVLMSRA